MKQILLSTDFSDNAMNAIEYGLQLFGSERVEYTLLNTYREPGSATSAMVSIAEYLRKESQELLEKTVSELGEKYPKHTISTVSKYGSLFGVVNGFAKQREITAIVVGTKGASQVENFFLGSNTMDVLKNVTVPTLIVPKDSTFNRIRTIALAMDFKPLKDVSILAPVVSIAKEQNAMVHVVHVDEPTAKHDMLDSPEAETLHTYLEDVRHQFDTVMDENIAAGIGAYAQEKEVNLLGIIARKHNFIERLFQKSITKEVSLMAAVPMFVVRE